MILKIQKEFKHHKALISSVYFLAYIKQTFALEVKLMSSNTIWVCDWLNLDLEIETWKECIWRGKKMEKWKKGMKGRKNIIRREQLGVGANYPKKQSFHLEN